MLFPKYLVITKSGIYTIVLTEFVYCIIRHNFNTTKIMFMYIFLYFIFCCIQFKNTAFKHPLLKNRCRYQPITQQYLKRCLIKDDSNYMFLPIAVIIRFSSESMVVVLYRIGMVMSRWSDPIKHYHRTFRRKPDDDRNRPKHVVTIIFY